MTYPRKQPPEAWAEQLKFADIERKHGLPAGVLVNLVRQESGGNCDALSPAGAKGLCQFMDATAKEMGVNSSDPVSSINGAARYLEKLMDIFDGDPEKAIAAYNCGPGRLRSIIKTHGNNWRDHLPKETKGYLKNVSNGIGRSFVQRQEAGEKIPEEDKTAETERRHNQLREVGIPDGIGHILGAIFFAIMKFFMAPKLEQETPQASQNIQDASVAVPVAPLPAPARTDASETTTVTR